MPCPATSRPEDDQMDKSSLQEFAALPLPEACRRIDFDRARLVALERYPPRYELRVEGNAPFTNMEVRLSPRLYPERPEFWGIEVVGCMQGVGLPALAPFGVTLPLDGTAGTQGVEVIGARCSEQLPLPPAAVPNEG